MSDVAGSETSGTPLSSSAAIASNGSGESSENPFAGLDTGTREWVEKKGYKSVGDLAKAAFHSEGLVGRSVQVPGGDAKPEDWDALETSIDSKLPADRRTPEKPDGYAFKMPEGLPEDMPYSEELAGKFKTWAHEAKIPPGKAQRLHDNWVKEQAGAYEAEKTAIVARATAATDALEKAWGNSATPEFKTSANEALAGIKGSGGEELLAALNEANLVKDVGGVPVVLSAPIAIAFAKIGKALYAEDVDHGAGAGGNAGSSNPFTSGPNTGNATERNILWKQDPERAKRMIVAAGFTPDQFGYRG